MAEKKAWEIWEEQHRQRQEAEREQQEAREHAKRLLIGLLLLYAGTGATPKIYRLLQHLQVDEIVICDIMQEVNRYKVNAKYKLKKAGIETLLLKNKTTEM